MMLARWTKCRPPKLYQLAAYLLLLLETGDFYGLLLPSLPNHAILTTCYSVLFAAVITAWLLTTTMDTRDVGVGTDRCRLQGEGKRLCAICALYVGGDSHHCRVCGKCIAGFDHHCVWLNTCIGSQNYRYFVCLVVFLEGLAILHLGTSLFVFSLLAGDERTEILQRFAISDSGVCYLVAVGITAAIAAVLVASIGFLLCFHIFICIKSTTTYELLRKAHQHRVAVYRDPLSNKVVPHSQSHSGPRKAELAEPGPAQTTPDLSRRVENDEDIYAQDQ